MALTKQQKQDIIEDLKEKIDRHKSIVFVDLKGLKAKNLFGLRKKIKEAGGQLKVTKKTMIKLVLEKAGLKLEKGLEGEIALVFAFEDSFSPLKEAYKLSQTNENLKILAGFFDGKFVEREETIILAKIPGREELLARLVGSISSPISGLVNVLQGNIRGLVYVLSQVQTKVNQ